MNEERTSPRLHLTASPQEMRVHDAARNISLRYARSAPQIGEAHYSLGLALLV
jgi:hypothetical protein